MLKNPWGISFLAMKNATQQAVFYTKMKIL